MTDKSYKLSNYGLGNGNIVALLDIWTALNVIGTDIEEVGFILTNDAKSHLSNYAASETPGIDILIERGDIGDLNHIDRYCVTVGDLNYVSNWLDTSGITFNSSVTGFTLSYDLPDVGTKLIKADDLYLNVFVGEQGYRYVLRIGVANNSISYTGSTDFIVCATTYYNGEIISENVNVTTTCTYNNPASASITVSNNTGHFTANNSDRQQKNSHIIATWESTYEPGVTVTASTTITIGAAPSYFYVGETYQSALTNKESAFTFSQIFEYNDTNNKTAYYATNFTPEEMATLTIEYSPDVIDDANFVSNSNEVRFNLLEYV